MTFPQPPAFLDGSNPLLAGGPARVDTGTVNIPGGPVIGVLTVRTASTTVTVMLTPGDAKKWARIISAWADSMSESGLHVASALPVPPPGNGHPPGR